MTEHGDGSGATMIDPQGDDEGPRHSVRRRRGRFAILVCGEAAVVSRSFAIDLATGKFIHELETGS